MENINLKSYEEFVKQVTSTESNEVTALEKRLYNLEKESGVNISLLLTGAIGLSSEGGEFNEIVKKCLFQGKQLNDETLFHLKRELGDIIWYWINACRSLNISPDDVILENVKKLESRYPGNAFDVFYSENRQKDDL